MKVKLILFVVFGCLASAKVRYDYHQVVRLFPENDYQLEFLRNLERNPQGLDFWISPNKPHKFVDIRVPPGKMESFHKTVASLHIKSETMIANLQEEIERSETVIPISKQANVRYNWDDYYDLDTLYEWMQNLSTTYPGIVEVIEGGTTFERRTIQGVKLSYKKGKPVVFIESGIHAREWIAPATATCVLNELLTSEDPDVRFIAENFEWHIFPSVNPDGYQYSHTTDRMWRKTRTPGTPCYGVDGNRNWDNYWNQGGASNYTCDETYAGTEPFSTIEAKSLAVTIFASNPTVYFCLHSYSQLLMIPYGHHNQAADNYQQLMNIGNKAAASLAKRYGTQYTVGPIADVIYVATGGSMDWVKSELKVPFTYEWELRDTGSHGFLLPADQIVPTCLETLDSMKTILLEVNATLPLPANQ